MLPVTVVRPVTFRHPVFRLGDPASSPLPCLSPLLLRNFSLEVCDGSREWHEVLHPPGARLIRRNLLPIVPLLIAGYSLMSWAPPDLGGDVWPAPALRGDVLPRLDGVLLPWSGFFRCHPSDGRLRISEDCHPFWDISSCSRFQCVAESSALRIVGLLVDAYAGWLGRVFRTFPLVSPSMPP